VYRSVEQTSSASDELARLPAIFRPRQSGSGSGEQLEREQRAAVRATPHASRLTA